MTSVLHAADVVLPLDGPPLRDGAVLVQDGLVVAVGLLQDLSVPGLRVRRWPGVLLPGLVDVAPLPEPAGSDVERAVALRVRTHEQLRCGVTAGRPSYLPVGDVDAVRAGEPFGLRGPDVLEHARELRAAGAADEVLVRAATAGAVLRAGARADLAAFDVPVEDPFAGLLEHGSGACVAAVVGGRLVHRR